jgi:hypothetical protein
VSSEVALHGNSAVTASEKIRRSEIKLNLKPLDNRKKKIFLLFTNHFEHTQRLIFTRMVGFIEPGPMA